MYKSVIGIPRRDKFEPIVSDHLSGFYEIDDPNLVEGFKQKEIKELADKVRRMPTLPFSEAREREILRLTQYYEAFATLFGIDLREVARTRTQINATVMYTSPVLLQAMFDDKGQRDDTGQTFFESRIQAGGFSFNATSINIIENYPMSFSVLKRQLVDAGGEYEIDYPAVSLPRQPFLCLKRWHDRVYSDKSLGENPILSYIADTFSYRIHDWIHQAILYDTNSATRIFQKWSDNSFFVEHFFTDPSMINYEFMSDKLHYLVWQQIFDEYPAVKGTLLENATIFLEQLDDFEKWTGQVDREKPADDTYEKMPNFLGYVGLRSLFNIIPLDELQVALGNNSRFEIIQGLLPRKYINYLNKLYEPIDKLAIPFRKGANTRLDLQQILDEYVNSLREEFHVQRLVSISAELWMMGARNNVHDLLKLLPLHMAQQIDKNMDLRYLDPRIILMLNKLFVEIEDKFGESILNDVTSRMEIDPDGYFYFMIDQNEVDLSPQKLIHVPYRKKAVLVQLPWSYDRFLTVTLVRSQNVIFSQTGATEQVSAGQIVLINIENARLAHELLKDLEAASSGRSFDAFWERLDLERARGHIALGDAYPYEWDKAKEVFVIAAGDILQDLEDRPILRPGYYETKPAYRHAARLKGPISMNTGISSARRRILSGCIVKNHVQKGQLDIFPVDALSFDKFYQVDRLSLPALSLLPVFTEYRDRAADNASNQILDVVLENLELINTARIHGLRGKSNPLKLNSLL